jgi:cyclase
MLAKRIIPCFDIKDGKLVKGTNFVNLVEAGDPIQLAQQYCEQGADELVFLDITATVEKRKTLTELAKKVASKINIPFTIGGGIASLEDVKPLLDAGADKVAINSAAISNPNLVSQLANRYGSQCVVLAVDSKFENGEHQVFSHGGRKPTGLKTKEWAKQMADAGAGEILLTSMDHDGTRAGFAIEITAWLAENLKVPIIASGGGGNTDHFADVFNFGKADAALAAGIFHFGLVQISTLKKALAARNIPVRL